MQGIVEIDFQECVPTKKNTLIFHHFFVHVRVPGASKLQACCMFNIYFNIYIDVWHSCIKICLIALSEKLCSALLNALLLVSSAMSAKSKIIRRRLRGSDGQITLLEMIHR